MVINMDDNFAEKVEGTITTAFKISGCPQKIFKEFKEFAMNECGDNYSMAIKVLLDYYRADAKFNSLVQEINVQGDTMQGIIDEIGTLKTDIDELRQNTVRKHKTFGGGE